MAHVFEEELLERESELSLLRELIAGASDEAGSVGLVEGPAGIGKSSLLREAMTAARAAGFETARARASEFERDFAFGLVRQLFEPKLSGLAPERRAGLFAGAAGLSAPLFEALDADELSPQGEAAHAVLHGLYWLTVNLATDRPLALAVDDAHWADSPSLRFLAYLVNRVDDLPIFLAVGTRPLEPGAEADLVDDIAASPATHLIRPSPLSGDAVDQLVRAALGADPAVAFSAACAQATSGNPLLLRELLATLTDEGIAPTAGQARRVVEVAPRSVARSVARRVRRLAPEAAELASAVAILGDGADLLAAAKLAGLAPGAAASAAEALARDDILRADALEFVHPVVRAAIFSELSPAQRSRQHRMAAGILAEQGADEDEVSLHVLAAEPQGDSWVVGVLRRGARRARSRGAPDVAASYLRRAVAEPPVAEERVDVLLDLGLAELAAMRMTGFDRMREALNLAADPRVHGRVALQLGRSLFSLSAFREAAKVFEEALAALGETDPALRERLEAHLLCVSVPDPSLHSPERDARITELLEDSARVSDPVLLATVAAATVPRVQPAERGGELAQRALADGRLSVEEDPAVVAMAAVALMAADRLVEAKRVWDRAIVEARSSGSPLGLGFAWTMRAFVLIRLGAIPAAEADAGGALEDISEDSRVLFPWLVTSLVDALLERGELDAASRLIEEHGLGGELPDVIQMNFLRESIARLRIAESRIDEGIAHLRECGGHLSMSGIRNPGLIPWRASLAPALAAVGEREEALALVSEEIHLARAFEVPRELGMALRAAGLVEGGTRAVELLREAVSVLERSPAELEHARALTDLGAALRRTGHRSEAREPLRRGLDLAQRCGATALAKRAHSELVTTGARPRRLVFRGVDALTASERRVAEMASEGLTNREIAQALFVTEKTVEGHLGHAYRKLDITSRSELSQALIRRPEPATA